jgi:hypothetical protein
MSETYIERERIAAILGHPRASDPRNRELVIGLVREGVSASVGAGVLDMCPVPDPLAGVTNPFLRQVLSRPDHFPIETVGAVRALVGLEVSP